MLLGLPPSLSLAYFKRGAIYVRCNSVNLTLSLAYFKPLTPILTLPSLLLVLLISNTAVVTGGAGELLVLLISN